MFVQTQKTPNPDSLKFLPGKKVSESGPHEILNKNETDNDLIRNILSINGVTGIFLGDDFLSVNKKKDVDWENIKHIVISHINEYYSEGNEFIISKKNNIVNDDNYNEIEKKIIKILETKVRPAVARDGGDIKFKEYKNGKEVVIDQYNQSSSKDDLDDIEKKIIKILDTKIRPAVARDGGDIKFQEFSNGIVKVKLQGSCSGCPSSTMTLKQGVQNLLCHYIPEVKEVLAI